MADRQSVISRIAEAWEASDLPQTQFAMLLREEADLYASAPEQAAHPDRPAIGDHDCADDIYANGVFDSGELSFDWGNKPLTASIPGHCGVCGRPLTLTLEVSGVHDAATNEVVWQEN